MRSIYWNRVLRTALVLGVIGGSSNAEAANSPSVIVRPISALSANELLHLPDTTKVAVNGSEVALGVVRTVHAARLRSFEQASALGRSVALTVHRENFKFVGNNQIVSGNGAQLSPIKTSEHEVRFESPASGIIVGNIVGQAPSESSLSPRTLGTSPVGWYLNDVGTIIPMPQSAIGPYGKDYQDFCTAAQATVCIYLPVILAWDTAAAGGPLIFYRSSEMFITDALVTDTSVCTSGGGSMGPSGCVYAYPTVQTLNFTPSKSDPYTANCPDPSVWHINFDPHGAVGLATTQPTWNGTSVAYCVAQVFAVN